MGSVWQYWGIAEAAIINGADPVATWQKLAADVQAADRLTPKLKNWGRCAICPHTGPRLTSEETQ